LKQKKSTLLTEGAFSSDPIAGSGDDEFRY
jgi:hypothetical protein